MPDLAAHGRVLAAELDWLAARLDARIKRHLGTDPAADPDALAPPALSPGETAYGDFVLRDAADPETRLLLALCLAPHIRPHALDLLFTRNAALDRGFTEFGGATVAGHGGFLPTGETALFLLCGDDLARRFAWQARLTGDHPLVARGALRLDPAPVGAPALGGAIGLAPDLVDTWTTGRSAPPTFGPRFPAHPLVTTETWDDLVLDPAVMARVDEIRAWLVHGPTLLEQWGFRRRMKGGFRSLLYGPPGTGKTMTAGLLGQSAGRAVYRVDLSMVVSKYIGETEKNLARVFEQAEGRDWILFFDEADALFGKRTEVRDAHDRFANQQVAYLLQRVETFDGVVLLASNLRDHIDGAFARRFHSIIYFPLPDRPQRRRLWQKVLAPPVETAAEVDLDALAEHEMSGAAIVNAVRAAALATLAAGEARIAAGTLHATIRRELQKEGRSL